jgi:hypothetical protein
MKVGIAISVYDKFDFVATNVNIIRKAWKEITAYISVCCNDTETYCKLESLDIDRLIRGEDYEMLSKHGRRLRAHDCTRKSISGALEAVDYVIHWMGDAFALNDRKILDLIDEMEERGAVFAGRGLGLAFSNNKAPYGDIDDHFFIVKSDAALECGLFSMSNHGTVSKLIGQGCAPEGVLAKIARDSFGDELIHIYSNMSECETVEGAPPRRIPPINLDSDRGFLHCDQIDELPKYLSRFGLDPDLVAT